MRHGCRILITVANALESNQIFKGYEPSALTN